MTINSHKLRLRNRLAGPAGDDLTLAKYDQIARAIEQAHAHEQLRAIAKKLKQTVPATRV